MIQDHPKYHMHASTILGKPCPTCGFVPFDERDVDHMMLFDFEQRLRKVTYVGCRNGMHRTFDERSKLVADEVLLPDDAGGQLTLAPRTDVENPDEPDIFLRRRNVAS